MVYDTQTINGLYNTLRPMLSIHPDYQVILVFQMVNGDLSEFHVNFKQEHAWRVYEILSRHAEIDFFVGHDVRSCELLPNDPVYFRTFGDLWVPWGSITKVVEDHKYRVSRDPLSLWWRKELRLTPGYSIFQHAQWGGAMGMTTLYDSIVSFDENVSYWRI